MSFYPSVQYISATNIFFFISTTLLHMKDKKQKA